MDKFLHLKIKKEKLILLDWGVDLLQIWPLSSTSSWGQHSAPKQSWFTFSNMFASCQTRFVLSNTPGEKISSTSKIFYLEVINLLYVYFVHTLMINEYFKTIWLIFLLQTSFILVFRIGSPLTMSFTISSPSSSVYLTQLMCRLILSFAPRSFS